MNKRGIGVVALVIVAFVAFRSLRNSQSSPRPVIADTVWYHESDVALLARTNRPQLVEFFHPN
jgi:hypothetical protein